MHEASIKNVNDIAANILSTLKLELGTQWELLKESDRIIITGVADDAAYLQIALLATPKDDVAGQATLAENRRYLEASLANIASINANEAATAFWKSFNAVLNGAVSVGAAALIALV